MKISTALIVSTVAFVASYSIANTPPPTPQKGTTTQAQVAKPAVAEQDRKFMTAAATGGRFEVEASKLAAQKASNPEVKKFATMLVDHHSAANAELLTLMKARGMAKMDLPFPKEQRKVIDQLQRTKAGAEFDRVYMEKVGLEAHQKDIADFEEASGEVNDQQLQTWINKTLPVIRGHLKHAQSIKL